MVNESEINKMVPFFKKKYADAQNPKNKLIKLCYYSAL